MIALADSIDDLTNPAQIAKLSDYPALQNILRNYGDQIKEISSEIAGMGEEERSVDLEMEIDAILSGNEIQETIIEGRWWANLVLKVKEFVARSNDELESLEKQVEENRRANGQTSLSIGKIMEYANGSNNDILQIVRDLGGLNSAANQIANSGSSTVGGNNQKTGGNLPADSSEIDKALERIAENSKVLNSFSEENNGLALSIALMAARGDASEQSLARFAEKLRETAERFNRLSGESADAVKILKNNLDSNHNSRGSFADAAPDMDSISRSISKISENIETRSHSLQEMIVNLGNELESLDKRLHQTVEDKKSDESYQEEASISEEREAFADDSELVIDHGKIWEGDQEDEEVETQENFEKAYLNDTGLQTEEPVPGEEISFVDNSVDPEGSSGGVERFKTDSVSEDFLDMSQESMNADSCAGDRALDDEADNEIYDIPEEAEVKSSPGPHEGGDWMEMPGNNWMKINGEIDSDEDEPVTRESDVSREPVDMKETYLDDSTDSLGRVTDAILAASGQSFTDQDEDVSTSVSDQVDNEEPVYDLFELGAVEYLEKA
ncbi:MAG: hypothetical protein E4H16_05095 [Candidatus Atribacteria bacterium]|nr:MAG: hypothetical protein E4H16_05095 [Candidatus Atribacteria bacterium]